MICIVAPNFRLPYRERFIRCRYGMLGRIQMHCMIVKYAYCLEYRRTRSVLMGFVDFR